LSARDQSLSSVPVSLALAVFGENVRMAKRVKATVNLKLECTRLKKWLGQPKLPSKAKEAVIKAERVDSSEIELNTRLGKIRTLERDLTEVLATRNNLLLLHEGLEDIAPHLNKSFTAIAIRMFWRIRLDNSSTLERIEQLRAGTRHEEWGLAEAPQNVIIQILDDMSANITGVLNNNEGVSPLPLGGVLDPDDFPAFTEVRQRSR